MWVCVDIAMLPSAPSLSYSTIRDILYTLMPQHSLYTVALYYRFIVWSSTATEANILWVEIIKLYIVVHPQHSKAKLLLWRNKSSN